MSIRRCISADHPLGCLSWTKLVKIPPLITHWTQPLSHLPAATVAFHTICALPPCRYRCTTLDASKRLRFYCPFLPIIPLQAAHQYLRCHIVRLVMRDGQPCWQSNPAHSESCVAQQPAHPTISHHIPSPIAAPLSSRLHAESCSLCPSFQ